MKKLAILLLALAMLLCLVACDKQEATEPHSSGSSTPSDSKPTPSDHSHSYTETVTAPTCTEGGYTTHICQCGETYQDAETPALGHTWQEATLESPKTCSVCGTTEGKPLPDARFDPELCAPLFGTWEVDVDGFSVTYIFNESGIIFMLATDGDSYNMSDYGVYFVADGQLWVGECWSEMNPSSYAVEGDQLVIEDAEGIFIKTSNSTQRPADPENKFDPAVCAPLFGTWEADMHGITMTYVFTDKGEVYAYGENELDRYVNYSTYFVVGEEIHTGTNWNSLDTNRFDIVDGTLTMYGEDGETVYIQMRKVSDNMEFVLTDIHTCEGEVKEVVVPTCNRGGYTVYTCSLCGEEKKDNLVEPLPHSWGTDGICAVCNGPCINTNVKFDELGNMVWGIGVDSSAQDIIKTLIIPKILNVNDTMAIPINGSILDIHCPNLEKMTITSNIMAFYKNAFEGCEKLTEIHFQGTVEQWNAIAKGEDWDKNTGDYTVYCTDGEIKKGE